MKLLNPHGSDETPIEAVQVYSLTELLNPHGSDETEI